MKILVTGGFGYVGSWIARHLAVREHEVFIVSRNTARLDLGFPYTLVTNDLAAASIEEIASVLPEGMDACIHAASYNESFEPGYAKKSLEINAYGTHALIEALNLKSSWDATVFPLFIYCSTFHVYGRGHGLITEETPPDPRNHYALTHLFAEEYCRMHAENYGFRLIITRLTNGYGAPLAHPFHKWYLLLNDLCRTACLEQSITLRSNPAALRDFIWLGDVAAAMENLLLDQSLPAGVYNIASGHSYSIKEIAERVARIAGDALGKTVPIQCLQPSCPVLALQVCADKLRQSTRVSLHDRMDQEIKKIVRFLSVHQKN